MALSLAKHLKNKQKRGMSIASRPKVTVIGCGHWGKNIVRNLAALGALGAIADQDKARAAEMAATYGVPAHSLDSALAPDAPSAVAIVTPIHTHADMVARALAAGKDVYVEKPIALDGKTAAQLVDVANKNQRVLMVGHLLRYHPAFIKLLEQVHAGAIGAVRHIAAHRLHFWPMHPNESVLSDLAPHDLAMIDGITARLPDLSPHAFHVAGQSFLNPGQPDAVQVHLRYGDITAHLNLSRYNPYKEHRFTVIGETGALVFDDARPWDEKLILSRPKGQTIHQAIALEMDEPLGREMQHFITCLETRMAALTGGDHAVRVSTILEALLK